MANADKLRLTKAFDNSSRQAFLDFKGDIKSLLQSHKYKLHTVLFEAKLHPAVARNYKAILTTEGVKDAADIMSRAAEFLAECDADAFAVLDLNIADATLRRHIRTHHDDQGHAAWRYIEGLYNVKGNDTRVTKAADALKMLIADGLTGSTTSTLRTFVESLDQLNTELHGTEHHMQPALMTTTVLDALSVHQPDIIRTFKAAQVGKVDWRKEFTTVRDTMYELLEENDRVEAKTAVHMERIALRTKVETQPSLESQLREAQAQIAALTQQMSATDVGKRGALQTKFERTPCPDCGVQHSMVHGCIGKRMAQGELTAAAAAALFKSVPEEKRMTRATASMAKYQAFQGQGPSPPTTGPPAGLTPQKRLSMCTRVIQDTRVIQVRSASSGGYEPEPEQDPPEGFFRLGMDSKCDQHIFYHASYFPKGVTPTKVPIVIATVESDGSRPIPVKGQGTASIVTNGGMLIDFPNALFVPDLPPALQGWAGLVSVGQAMKQSMAEVRFGDYRDIFFHQADVSIPLDGGYDLFVRPAAQQEAHGQRSFVFANDKPYELDALPRNVMLTLAEQQPIDDPMPEVTTRGKATGGAAAKMNTKDVTRLWSARLPGVSAPRMQQMPDMASGAPKSLAHAKAEHITNDATLTANAPKLHAPAVSRPKAHHRGDLTVTDLMSFKKPSKFTGNRYVAPHVDMHDGTIHVSFLPSKDKYPQALRSYITLNDGRNGCKVSGGTLYRDNEAVLNSSRVTAILREFDMQGANSCEYEPWGNGSAERTMRTLQEPARIMHARSGAGEEYAEFSIMQSALIANATPHSWGATDDGKTPFERKTGQQPSVGQLRTMFCKAFVRRPPHMRSGKMDTRADLCIHLGSNPRGPGYRFEVLEGPRKGRLITSTQAVFREHQFPFRDLMSSKKPSTGDIAGDATAQEIAILYPDAEASSRATGGALPADLDDDSEDGQDDTSGGADGGDDRPDDTEDSDDLQDASEDSDSNEDDAEPDPSPGAAPAPARRSHRIAGDALPQTTFGFTKFRGVLSTRAISTHRTAFATGVDMTNELVPHPLTLDIAVVPSPKPLQDTMAKLPKSFADIQAIEDEHERHRRAESYFKEYDGLFEAPSGLRVVPKPPGVLRTVKLKEIYSDKKDGTAKMRVVARGDLMQPGVDFDRTFSPTVKLTTFRLALALAAQLDYSVSGGDVSQAYVRADWPDDRPDLYADKFPTGYQASLDGQELAILIGNLYGTPPAGRAWYKKVSTKMMKKFHRSSRDHAFFWRWEGKQLMMVLLYVDDIIMIAPKDNKMRNEFAEDFGAEFPWVDFGEDIGASNREYVGIRITQATGMVTIDSERYIEDLLTEFFPGGVHATYAVPARPELPKMVEEAIRRKTETNRTLSGQPAMRYRRMVGALLYVSITTRPDIAYAVGMLSRCVSYPTAGLLIEVERVLLYLGSTRELGITYHGDANKGMSASWAPTIGNTFEGTADASFEVPRSTSGYEFSTAGAAFSWGMKKQSSTALHTAQAEIMAASLACCEAVHQREFHEEVGFPQKGPTILRMDNSAAIDMSYDPVSHASTKHIQARDLHIRDLVRDGLIKPIHVKTADNTSDIFTKPLQRKAFQKHRAALLGLS